MSSEQKNAMVDYARLYDMSQVEINLFYKKDEEELIDMIEGMFSKEIGRLRSLLIEIRKRKTDIKTLRSSLENPVEYFENLMDNVYSESEGNIKSLKVTIKKVKSVLQMLEGIQEQLRGDGSPDSPIHKVFNDQVDFMRGRLDYYENAMEKYRSYIESSKEYKALKKNPEEFEKKAQEYCRELLGVVEIEEAALKADEETYRAQLEEWRTGRNMFQDQYEKQIIKSLE